MKFNSFKNRWMQFFISHLLVFFITLLYLENCLVSLSSILPFNSFVWHLTVFSFMPSFVYSHFSLIFSLLNVQRQRRYSNNSLAKWNTKQFVKRLNGRCCLFDSEILEQSHRQCKTCHVKWDIFSLRFFIPAKSEDM